MHNNNNNDSQLIQSVGYNNNYASQHHFALCESCFWSATIFKSDKKQEQIINTCPVCFNENNISLIPLTRTKYTDYLLDPKVDER